VRSAARRAPPVEEIPNDKFLQATVTCSGGLRANADGAGGDTFRSSCDHVSVIIAVGPGCAMPTNEPEPPTLSQHAQLSDGSSRFISKYLGDDALGMVNIAETSPARIRA